MMERQSRRSLGGLILALLLSLVVLTGVLVGGHLTDVVIASTGDLGSWTSTSSLATPTWAFAAAGSPNYVYVSGGEITTTGHIAESASTLRAAINSDGNLGSWQEQTSLSIARIDHGMVYTETAAGNRCLFVVGGYTGATPSSLVVTDSVEYALVGTDGTIGSWAKAASMSTARAHFGLAAYGGRLYSLGGSSTAGSVTSTVEFAPINSNCSLDSWQATTAMTATHSGNRAFAANGYLYSTGDISGTLATGVQYAPINTDGTVGAWASTSLMSQQRADHAAIASTRAGYAYVLGGVSTSPFTRTATVERALLNPNGTLGNWSIMTSLPSANEDMAFAQADGRIYILGGSSAGITSTVIFNAIEGAGSPNLAGSSTQISSSSATPGQTVTYTVVLSNTGSGPANARVTNTLPVSVTYVSGSATNGATFDSASRSIRWSGVVSSSTAVSITYRAVIMSPLDNGLLITNTATVNDGNGSVIETPPVTTTVSSAPDLGTSRLVVSRPIASPGGTIKYSVVVSNTGTMNTSARVTDTLPLSLTYVANTLQSTMGTSVYDPNSGSVLWAGPALVGVPVTISYQAQTPAGAASGAVITNSATIQGAGANARETNPVTVTVASNPSRIGWENLGLYGIRAGDIAIDPSSGTVYVVNGGSVGVYRTLNEGEVWLPSANVSGCGRLLLNQSTGSIYASCSPGADLGGLWKSTDNGLTWNPVLNKTLVPGKRDGPVSAVAMSGSSLYVADGNAPEAPGPAVWVSTDAGATWTRKTIAPSGGVNAVAADASNPAVVYAATATNVYRSADSGVNWADITPTGGADFKVVATSPLSTSVIFVASGYDGGLKIYKSSNAGQSWSTVYAPTDPRETPISTITFHPSDPNKMYSEIGESTDAGETWHFWQAGAGGRGMAIHPLNPSIIYGRHTLGVRRSSDGGVTWANINTGLEEVSIKGVAENPRDPNNFLIASAMGFGSTFDNGESWNWPLDMSATPQPDMFGEAVALEPSGAYLSGGDSILGRSTDGGRTWGIGNLQQLVQNDLTLSHRPEVAELRLVPGETGHLLAAVRENSETSYVPKGGVYESNDGGLTWAPTGLTGVPVNTIDLGQTSGRTVIYAGVGNWRANSAGPGGIYTSTVGNTSVWSQTNVTSTAPTILRIRLDPTNPLVAYAGGRSQLASRFGRPDLFKTTDGGATWLGILTEAQANASTMPVRAVAVDPAFPANVFYASSNNVYQSVDGGSTWSLLSDSNLGFEWINTLIVPLSAPSPVVNFTAMSIGNQTVLSWTNPSDTDLSGVTIKYSTTSFPALSTEGITLTTLSGVGSTGVYTHTGAVTGTTYYYSAFASNQAGRYSTPRQVAVQAGTNVASPSVAEMLGARSTSGLVRRPAAEASTRNLYAAAGGGLFAKEVQAGASSGTRIYVPLVPREFTTGW